MLDVSFLERCILTIERANELLLKTSKSELEYDLYRSACVKEFELIQELAGKLLKKALRPYFSSHKAADMLVYKDVFRNAALHGLIGTLECERWLLYRDHRNETAHEYGESFAEETLTLMPSFITDCQSLLKVLKSKSL